MMAPHATQPTPFQWDTDSGQIRPQPFEHLQTISTLRTVDKLGMWTGLMIKHFYRAMLRERGYATVSRLCVCL